MYVDYDLIYNVAITLARHRSKNAQRPLNPPMARLSLNFLGAPEIQYDRRPIAFPTRKALALLIYLAVEGKAQPRDKLTALLWPDSPGASTMRSTLAMLRKALGEASSHVVADRNSLRFDLTPDIDFDLQALQSTSQLARQLPMTNNQSLLTHLTSAASLVRGDFLEGFSLADAPEFDTWASVQREVLHRQAMNVFDGLSQIQFDRGEMAKAIETALHWTALDPLDEAAHRRLMICHFTRGDRPAGLQAYEACRALLKRELNVEPSPETESLAKRLQTQPPPSRKEDVGQDSGRRAAALIYEAPLVGRANEHLEMVTAFRSARQGQTQIMLIEGEPGIGKTRLAKEFLAWTSAQGATVLPGRAFEMGSQVPYQVVMDALRSSSLQSLVSSLSPAWLAELARLLPELHDLRPNLPAPLALTEAESRSRLFEAVARMGQALVEAAPARVVVTFVDDLQWADAASLDLLAYVTRRWAASRIPALLILASRSEDMAQLNEWLTGLARDLPCTRRTLQPLSFDEASKMIRGLQGERQLAANDISQLFADTKGHPFFIIQTLNALSESDERYPHLPTGIRNLIRSRLSRLTPNASLLCATGAVFGAGFGFDQLCHVTELTEGAGLSALEELLRRGLWRETRRDVPAERLYFTHDWIREVAYADLSETRRRILHRRALAVGNMPLADQARHALAAGLLDRAFNLCLAAGDEAMSVFATRNAITLYEQASLLLASYQPSAAGLQTLYLKLGRAYELSSKWSAARTAFQELLRLARGSHDSGFESTALIRLSAVAAASTFDLPTAFTLLREAQEVAEGRGDTRALIEIELNLAEMGVYRWNAAEMMTHGERGLTLARELGRDELAAHCLNRLAYAGLAVGDWAMAETSAREASALYAQLGDRLLEAESQTLLGAIQCQTERLRAGIETIQIAYQTCRDLENNWGQANSASHLARGLCEAGKYGQALAIAQTGVAAARAADHAPQVVGNLIELGRLYRELFALDEARAAHAEALKLAELLQHPWLIEVAAEELCADGVLAGDWAEALVRARRAAALRETDPTLKLYASLTLWAMTEAMLHGSDDDVARALADVRRCSERVDGKRRYRIPYLRALAVLAQREGKVEEANAHLREAASIAESLDLPGELWPLYALLGEQHKAAEIVQSLATNIDDEKLREGFLSAGPVRQAQVRLAETDQ